MEPSTPDGSSIVELMRRATQAIRSGGLDGGSIICSDYERLAEAGLIVDTGKKRNGKTAWAIAEPDIVGGLANGE